MRRTLLRAATVVAVALTATFAFTLPASAHVTVSSTAAVQGGYAKVTFRVPNERDNASTVKLEVVLPTDAPVASVSIKPVPGWTAKPETGKFATPVEAHGQQISEGTVKITWTAASGTGIKPDEFQEFEVSMGPLPKVDQLVFKSLQTYSSGEVVRWIEVPGGATEPEHPAPVLKLAKSATTAATAPTENEDSSGTAGVWLGSIGILLGAGGLALGFPAYRRVNAS